MNSQLNEKKKNALPIIKDQAIELDDSNGFEVRLNFIIIFYFFVMDHLRFIFILQKEIDVLGSLDGLRPFEL